MTRAAVQLIREGEFAADVEIGLNEGGSEWGPTVGLPDIQKLDRVRLALRSGDIVGAARESQVYRLVPEPRYIERQTQPGFQEDDQNPVALKP